MTPQHEARYLSCPCCGKDVKALPSEPPDEDWPDGFWWDGKEATCETCGTRSVVVTDEFYPAHLREVDDDDMARTGTGVL